MVFNAAKFELLRFWVDRETAPDILYMAPDGGPIEEKDCLRDLGVRVSTDLTFSMQIDMVVESGSRMAGWAQEGSHAHSTAKSDPANDGLLQPVIIPQGPILY